MMPTTTTTTTKTTTTTTSRDSDGMDGSKSKKRKTPSGTSSKHANETPEERIKRRIEKKARKEAKRLKEQQELFGYTNEDNPFGDSRLTEKFVWNKRNELLQKKGFDVPNPDEDTKQKQKDRQKDIAREIALVKERRKKREEDRRLWEEEKLRLARQKELDENRDWERREDEFQLKQARKRFELRLAQGRAKPIDIVAKNVLFLCDAEKRLPQGKERILQDDFFDSFDDASIGTASFRKDRKFEIDLREPYKIFENLNVPELEDLLADVRVHQELAYDADFWDAMQVVGEAELEKLLKGPESSSSSISADDARIHQSIKEDVKRSFLGKSHSELLQIQREISTKITSGAEGVDVEYWSTLLKELTVWIARAKLREYHERMLHKQLELLEQILRDRASSSTVEPTPELSEQIRQIQSKIELGEQYQPPVNVQEQQQATDSLDVTTLSADMLSEDAMLQMMQSKMTDREEVFAEEIDMGAQTYSWNDKYRPRKPRFFNRVHTGFEWTKYNQTHYDRDNPPPKVVKGYKFNIFYPDLIDKTQAPQYFISKDPQSEDTVMLRFHAGPPYEDIAFKIVNREWEFSHRRGYKCTFERGIFHLYFNFRRYRYRR